MTYHKVHLWGDSIGKGVIFDEGRGRYSITPGRCVVQLEEALGIPIVNHARMGATCPEGLADFVESAPDPGTIVVIEYGGNDCDMPWKEVAENPEGDYNGQVPIDVFEDTLRAFVEAVRVRGMVPLLVTPPPLEAQRYFDWVTQGISKEGVLAFLGDVYHIYRWQERYSVVVRNVAQEMGCALFDMRYAFLNHRRYPELICLDGIHANAKGHAVIAEAVMKECECLRAQLKRV